MLAELVTSVLTVEINCIWNLILRVSILKKKLLEKSGYYVHSSLKKLI